MRWMHRDLATVGGLYNDKAIDHFIAVKHAWADAAVRALAQDGPVRVLETHSGYGWLTVTYAIASAAVTAIERNAEAVGCLRANTAGLPVDVRHGDAAKCLPDDDFDIIDVDASGSPQPVLDAVLARYRPRVLFVTFGDVLYYRFRRGRDLPAGVQRYGDVWRERQHELDRGARNFGDVIGFEVIRRAWPDVAGGQQHVWPLTGSTRVAATRGITIDWPTVEDAAVWCMAQQR